MHGKTEPGYEACINLVVLGPKELAPGKPLDSGRIDDTHNVSLIIEIGSQFIPIRTRCFHTHMGIIDPLFFEP
jgi:hypothetical protein